MTRFQRWMRRAHLVACLAFLSVAWRAARPHTSPPVPEPDRALNADVQAFVAELEADGWVLAMQPRETPNGPRYRFRRDR